MAAGQQRRRERERAERQLGVGGADPAPPPLQLDAALARERAVIEMSRLRQEVFDWMQVRLEQGVLCAQPWSCSRSADQRRLAAAASRLPSQASHHTRALPRDPTLQAFEDTHGRKPTLPETAEASPAVYERFVRYMALRDALRSAPAAPPPRSPAVQAALPGQARAAPGRGAP